MRASALVIGGGIGGLAAAIGLRRAGVDVRVFERAAEIKEVGAGLSLWPNGLRALDALGAGDEVRARSVPDLDSGLRTWRGRVLVAANSAEVERMLGDVSVIIHRADLLALLRSRLPDDAVVTGAQCITVIDDGDGVTAHFHDNSQARGDFLVGADGLHSIVRARLFGARDFAPVPPSYAGYTAWRAVLRFDHAALLPGISIGRGSQFGQVPMAGGMVYWFATENGPPDRAVPPEGWRAALVRLFQDWHAPIAQLIAATPESAILHNDIVDRPPLATWGRGPITLLGDAAHPMTPNLGQGANQALEDAVALAGAVQRDADVTGALRAYEKARAARASGLIVASRRVGRVLQLSNPLACWLRDAFLGTSAARRMQLRQLRDVVAPPDAARGSQSDG